MENSYVSQVNRPHTAHFPKGGDHLGDNVCLFFFSRKPRNVLDGTAGAYDCNIGFEHWREAWTLRHQRWCCPLSWPVLLPVVIPVAVARSNRGFSENKACAEKIVHRDHYIQVIRHGDAMHGHFSHSFLAVFELVRYSLWKVEQCLKIKLDIVG